MRKDRTCSIIFYSARQYFVSNALALRSLPFCSQAGKKGTKKVFGILQNMGTQTTDRRIRCEMRNKERVQLMKEMQTMRKKYRINSQNLEQKTSARDSTLFADDGPGFMKGLHVKEEV